MSTRAQIAASLVLLVLFAAYGMQAMTIPSFPGQELEPFKPRTMPIALAAAGLLLIAIRILQLIRTRESAAGSDPASFDWKTPSLLCVAMLAYGFMMIPLGFVPATTLFLAAGFLILGERRKTVLIVLPLAFSVVFFLLMTRGLGLYLSSGAWFAA